MSDRIYECPSPDDCPFKSDSAAGLAAHVNSEHEGEYQREDWPNMPAGHVSRQPD